MGKARGGVGEGMNAGAVSRCVSVAGSSLVLSSFLWVIVRQSI